VARLRDLCSLQAAWPHLRCAFGMVFAVFLLIFGSAIVAINKCSQAMAATNQHNSSLTCLLLIWFACRLHGCT
jgi:hypothetical protein